MWPPVSRRANKAGSGDDSPTPEVAAWDAAVAEIPKAERPDF